MTTDLALASDAGLGYYSVGVSSVGSQGDQGSFYVEEYKKPEYQVKVTPSAQRVLQGNNIQAVIDARYFFGEPVANAKVKYVVHTSQHYWWDEEDADDSGDAGQQSDEGDSDYAWDQTEQQEQEGVLDADGKLTVSLPVAVEGKARDMDYRIEARVTDAANREVAGHATVLATYGSFHIDAQPTSYIYKSGDPVRVKVQAEDYDSKPVQTAIHAAVTVSQWDRGTGKWTRSAAASRDATTGADGSALIDLSLSGNGDYEVTVTAQTPEHRIVEAQTWVWIWNGGGEWANENTQARIVADKKSYQVGDTAHLLLLTGVPEAWAVVTTEGDTIQSRQLLHASGESVAFDVPITSWPSPTSVINAFFVRNNQIYTAHKSLKVPLVERTLTITATPSKPKYLPGEKGSFDVTRAR